ncbi:synaptotagmin-like protein 2 isoform X2 [Myripristis murdjan]|uniref:synaptotagmin-like protein 2 isoform X2 n=1 Tax=Myripristis murdjan TaxID=586833 RepID=UPI001175F433|nr:synaptotagmin-like protein 2 isoform X2 [Myripristis murdjan]
MIDLSFLTEEEQETILAVLKRDAELKKAEENRIRKLQRSVSNKGQLKYLTGEWFYETKSLRHQDRIHGSDIIRASMRHTHKPLTILELSRILPERPSFVSSENKEVFVPSQLSGLIQEPEVQLSSERDQNGNPHEKPPEILTSVVQSPTKQRQNPFNNEPLASHISEETDSQLVDGPAEQTETLCGDLCEHCHKELLSPQVSNLVSAEQKSGKAVHLETGPEEDHHSQSKATDLLIGHSIHQQQLKLPEQSSDKLDMFGEVTSDTKLSSDGSSKNSSQSISPKPQNRLLGIFTEEKTAELQSTCKEEQDDNQKLCSPQSTADVSEDNQINFASVKQEAKIPGTTEVRTLQLTALQHTPFKEAMTSVGSDLDTQQDPTETKDRISMFPQRLSNLKAFWEKENSGPKIIFTREQTRHENIPKTEIDASHSPQNIQIESVVEKINNNLSAKTELTEHCRFEDNAAQCHEEISSPEIESSFGIDLSKEDCTYRANPVVICEETDESLTGSITDSQIPEPEENNTPLSVSLPCNIPVQYQDIPVPLPRQSSPQENRPGKISDLTYFWEKESSGPRVISAKVKEASSSPVHSSLGDTIQYNEKIVASHSDLRGPLGSIEKSEEEVQTSSYSTKTNSISNTKHVTDKGFVSQSSYKPQLRSSANIGDIDSTCQQYQGKTETESVLPEERPLSPSRPQTPKSKDSSDDEVRRSPSKTCHPKALPRESSSPKGSRLEGSPLKTFPIDIAPSTKAHEEQSGRPTPAPRKKQSPSHEAKQSVLMDIKSNTEIHPPRLDSVQSSTPSARGTNSGSVYTQMTSMRSSTGLHPRKASESGDIEPTPTKRDSNDQNIPGLSKKSGTFPHLARSFIQHDYQHYLGAPENAHLPPFGQEEAVEESTPVLNEVPRPQSPLRDFKRNQGYRTTKENQSRISSWIVQSTDSNCSQDRATTAWSQSRASSGSHDDDSSPVRSALKRLSSKPMSSSKSLESLTAHTTREERSKNNPRGQPNISMDDVSALPPAACSLSDTEQMKKMSASVPVFQLEELDSDSTSDIMDWKRNTGSSISNISLSSGMASMSSVSGSMSSIYPADSSDIEVQGTIQFAVNYVQKLGEFHIFVVHCRDLAVAERKKNRTDPYVKCYLLPDKTKLGKRKSSVKKKTVNPTYNEILRFKITMDVLKMQILNISVWHHDTFGRNSFLGEVEFDLSEWDFSNAQINEYALKARVSAQISPPSPSWSLDKSLTRGQMRVALRFLPQLTHSKRTSQMETGEVQIWVKDCKNLPPVRGVIIDPFVKCTVLPDTSRKSRQKTRVVKRTANPMFNHTMVYDGFRPEDLREACVEITVWDHDRLSNHYIGGLRLGLGTGKSYGAEVVWMDSTTEEANLWKRMMQSHGEWVEDVLPLRMFVMAKSTSK